MEAKFRPLQWAGSSTPPESRRSRYTFKANWSSTLDLLDRELWNLDARDLVIEADFSESDIRLDGMPRSNARQPIHPGVRIAFASKHGSLIYQTDTCEFWQHNVRSIALGLEALRAVDRYGVSGRGEQYTGWKAIGSGMAMPAAPSMRREDAIRALVRLADWSQHVTDDPPIEVLTKAYRDASFRLHPDKGGRRQDWDLLQTVWAVLK